MVPSLNRLFSKPTMKRRYEVWFLRLALADGSGAWWFRYLLMNLGRAGGGGCAGDPRGQPVQVWATWFPRGGRPQSFIQGFPQEGLHLSPRGGSPFHLELGDNSVGEDGCCGRIQVDGHEVRWDLRYHSTCSVSMTEVGWIGFSRTPHSDAVFRGEINFDGRVFRGEPLGFGLQGHNCGFRHRHRWTWAHAYFGGVGGRAASTFEALVYERPLGLPFRKALLWHSGRLYTLRKLKEITRERDNPQWKLRCLDPSSGISLEAEIDGRGPSVHRLPYLKTNCQETFEVANNSLAKAAVRLNCPGQLGETLVTADGATLEMVGV